MLSAPETEKKMKNEKLFPKNLFWKQKHVFTKYTSIPQYSKKLYEKTCYHTLDVHTLTPGKDKMFATY